MDSFVQELFTSRGNYGDGTTRVGQKGRIWYDSVSNAFRVGDGVTPGGIVISGGGGYFDGGGATGSFDFNIAADDSTQRTVNSGETVQFLGSRGVSTSSNSDGVITITGPDLSVYALSSALASYALSSAVPTNTNQLTNGAAFITASALTGLATETYVTTRGYITSSALTNYALTSAVPTNNNQLTNGAGYITSSSLTGLATETYVTTRGYITSAALSGYALTSAIPTDISQLADSQGLLGQGDGGGGTIIRNVENPYSFSVAGDDSTLREIANGESIKFTGASGVAVTTDAEGNITITGPSLTGLATETYVTTRGYITSSALTGLATETYVTTQGYITSSALTGYALTSAIPTNNNQLTNGSGYITSAALTGLATESYVTSRGYITGLSYNDLTDKPNLAGTYSFNVAADDSTLREISTDETVKFIGAGGVTTASDAEGNITITGPSLTGLATETYVTTRGYITSSALTGLASETFVTSQGYITSSALTGLATETYVTTKGYITSSALTGLATESYVTSRGYITGLSYNDLTDKPNLAGTYSWSIAADDSTQFEISAGNLVKIKGAGGITTASDADGNITITGSAPDRLTSNARSAVLNSNGTFSLPTMTSAPTSPQAGQMALANGTSWDPIAQNNGAPYLVVYTGSSWIGMGGVTVDQVYNMILEMG